jgi:predicted regulator of Ras-like GTPase activity (Roadblock/LC7/MglB family)
VSIPGGVDGQLDWLLADFVRGTPGVVHALVVSGDGLRLAASERVDARLGDRLAAATSGLVSLARGTAQLLDTAPVSHGSTLAVVADRNCDMGMVGYEMTLLAARVGHVLTPAPRVGSGWTQP